MSYSPDMSAVLPLNYPFPKEWSWIRTNILGSTRVFPVNYKSDSNRFSIVERGGIEPPTQDAKKLSPLYQLSYLSIVLGGTNTI